MKNLKTWKLERDKKRMIVDQIVMLKTHSKAEISCDFYKMIYSLKKKDLIKIWVESVEQAAYPDLDFLLVYY